MRIGELAERAGISTKAIRYYEQLGILAEPARTPSGYRDYDQYAVGRLAFVRAGQVVGLTLGELRRIIALRDHGEVPCEHVPALLRQRSAELDARIGDLQHCGVSLGACPNRRSGSTLRTARQSGSATSSADDGDVQPGSRIMPRSSATVTAAVRSSTPSLAKMRSRWVLTVADRTSAWRILLACCCVAPHR